MSNLTKTDLTLVKQLTLMFSQIENQIEVPGNGGHEGYSHTRIFAERIIDSMVKLYNDNETFYNKQNPDGSSHSLEFDAIDYGRTFTDQAYANSVERTLSIGRRCIAVSEMFNPAELIKSFESIFKISYVPIEQRVLKAKSPKELSTLEQFAKSLENDPGFIELCKLRKLDLKKEIKTAVDSESIRRRDEMQNNAIQNR